MKASTQSLFLAFLFFSHISYAADGKPNILWIITDDQRSDSLVCYNRATTGKAESELGSGGPDSLHDWGSF